MSAGARGVVLEAAVVLAGGLMLGLLANFVSPQGLKLGRDYFPKATVPAIPATLPQVALVAPTLTNTPPTETNAVLARLRARGLQPLDHATVLALFHDPKRTQESIIFVDVRNSESYQAGHVPGAHLLDYYRPEPYLAAVLSACGTAEKIVVYCTGGDCEDSELAAVMLGQAGVPRERIFIYPGGFAEWSAQGLPLELEGRLSGVLKGGGP
jgi:rhodanese-related sulfurtransferase